MLEKLPEILGHALVNQRAGMEQVVYNQLHRLRETARIGLRSKSFVFNGELPVRFTADGDGVSPPLEWDMVPPGTESLALIVEDADSPTPHPMVHAIVVGLEGAEGELDEAALTSPHHEGVGLATGPNSFLQHAWLPPDPPRGHGEHRYVFQIFALRSATTPPADPGAVALGEVAPGAAAPGAAAPGRRAFIDMVLERAIGVGCLIGTYERTSKVGISPLDEEVVANGDSALAGDVATA